MKTFTVKLPEAMAASIEAESLRRGITRSDVVRDRLQRAEGTPRADSHLDAIRHLIGSVEDDLPADVSARVDHYLRKTGFGRNTDR